MSLYNGPPRGGTRGGADQFNWENVKVCQSSLAVCKQAYCGTNFFKPNGGCVSDAQADPDREFYLGHSVKATTGRWQKGLHS